MDAHQLEALHQEASEHYLNGRFDAALEAWQRLLQLDPADEVAQEGVRLARHMLEGEQESIVEGASDAPGLESSTGPDPGESAWGSLPERAPETESRDDAALDELDACLDSVLGGGKASSETDAAGESAPELPDPARQNEGLEFEGLEDVAPVPLAGTVPADEPRRGLDGLAHSAQESADPEEPVAGLDLDLLDDPPQPAGASPAPVTPSPEAGVDHELKQRVRDLLDEAEAHAQAGRISEALTVIARIYILDENNEEAGRMEAELRARQQDEARHVEQWMTEAIHAMDEGDSQTARSWLERVLSAMPHHLEARAYLEKLDAAVVSEAPEPSPPEPVAAPSPPVDSGTPGVVSFDMDQAAESVGIAAPPAAAPEPAPESEAEPPAAAARAPRPRPRPQKTVRRRRTGLWLVLVLAAGVGVAGYLSAPMLMGGASSDDLVVPVAGDRAAGTPGGETLPAAVGPGVGEAADARPRDRGAVIAEAMSRASEAMQRKDYESAILAYNDVLSVEPGHEEARAGLLEAGEKYREHKAILDQYQKAKLAFEDGDYRSALRTLYRLPEDVEPARVRRYKVNGWYNLGLMELRAGDCDEAMQRFDEALALDPADAGVKRAREFARRYQERTKDASYYRRVEAMGFRALED